MKIAYLTPEYPHNSVDNSSGGIGTSIFNLAEGIKKIGHRATILVYNQAKDEIIKSHEATIYKIKNVKLKGLSWWLTRKKIERLINKLHKEDEIELIEAPDWTGFTSFMKLSCPIVIKLHGSDTYFCHLEKRKSKYWNRFHEKKALKSADAHISVSEFTAKETNSIFGTKIKFKIIPNSISPELFKSNDKQENQKGLNILYFGTLIRKKGALEIPYIFNEVLKRLPKAKLRLLGKDSYDIKTKSPSTYTLMIPHFNKAALKQQEYLGQVTYDRVKKFIASADVVIFPSYVEALPLSWLEAMAMEKVVVTSNIGWSKEIITHGKNGFMVHPTNYINYAETILKILNENIDVKQISYNARQTILEKFSNRKIAVESMAFYNKVARGR